MTKDQGPMMETRDAAEMLGVSMGTLNAWRRNGKYELGVTRVGTHVVYDREDVENVKRIREGRVKKKTKAKKQKQTTK